MMRDALMGGLTASALLITAFLLLERRVAAPVSALPIDRYRIVPSPGESGYLCMIDTATGRIWRCVIDPNKGEWWIETQVSRLSDPVPLDNADGWRAVQTEDDLQKQIASARKLLEEGEQARKANLRKLIDERLQLAEPTRSK